MAALAAGLTLAVPAGHAQEFGLPDSAILVIDPNRLFSETAFGTRLQRELEAEEKELAAENRRLEEELEAEEKALTEERAGMAPEAFRDKADAFDAKVQRIRRDQLAKAEALTRRNEIALRQFLGVTAPVLEAMLGESGAAVLLDQRSVILSLGSIDVTAEAARRIDEAIGDGADLSPIAPVPEPSGAAQD